MAAFCSNTTMNKEFLKAWHETVKTRNRTDWLCWLGQPMLYDGGLCVNRSDEELAESNKYKGWPD